MKYTEQKFADAIMAERFTEQDKFRLRAHGMPLKIRLKGVNRDHTLETTHANMTDQWQRASKIMPGFDCHRELKKLLIRGLVERREENQEGKSKKVFWRIKP